jgi:hypothetical protein
VAARNEPAGDQEGTWRDRIVHRFFVRLHMTLILSAVIASGMLASKTMLVLGMHSLRLRYPLAVLASYLVFLGLIRVWIWYISLRTLGAASLGNLSLGNMDLSGSGGGSSFDVGFGGGGGGGSSVSFGGGSSGGGGASGTWDDGVQVGTAQLASGSSSGHSGWFGGNIDFDLDDDGWVLILLVVLIFGIVCAGGYLIYAAPHFLPEAASQAFLASALTRVSKEEHHGWMPGVLRATAIPFAVVLILAGALGWAAHSHCPAAARLMDALPCVGK